MTEKAAIHHSMIPCRALQAKMAARMQMIRLDLAPPFVNQACLHSFQREGKVFDPSRLPSESKAVEAL